MSGMSAITGRRLAGIAHLRQSVTDILTTPIGSRVMRRQYGSRLFDLVDAPMSPPTLLEIYAATAEALDLWEPRLRVTRIEATSVESSGGLQLNLDGLYRPQGVPVRLEGIVL